MPFLGKTFSLHSSDKYFKNSNCPSPLDIVIKAEFIIKSLEGLSYFKKQSSDKTAISPLYARLKVSSLETYPFYTLRIKMIYAAIHSLQNCAMYWQQHWVVWQIGLYGTSLYCHKLCGQVGMVQSLSILLNAF